MRRFLPRSFFWQLVLATAVVQTLFLLLFIWFTVVTQRRESEVRSRERIAAQLNHLSAACANQIERGDMSSLQNVLELSRIAPTIEAARLTDLQGNTLAVTSRGRERGLDTYERAALPTATTQQVFRIRNGLNEAVAPVMIQGKPAALLWLEPNHSSSLNTAEIVIRIAAAYGGFALLANLLPIFIIVRTVTRPLNTLRQATAAVVRNPNLTAAFPLPVTTSNEAGELTTSFNLMVRELEEQRRGMLETLALLDSMLSNAPIGLAFVDREMRYVRVNEFLAEMHGLPMEDHTGLTPAQFYPEQVGMAKLDCVQRVFATGRPVRNVELSGPSAEHPGIQRTWLMHFYPVRTEAKAVQWVGIIAMEITDRLRAEETLRKTEKLAATGRLAASIAHEINNPLESVTNLLYLLGTHEPMDPTAAQIVETAQAELARVSHITQQTLRFYRQSSLPSLTNIAEILDAILLLYHTRIMTSRVTVQKTYSANTEIFGFNGEIRQLFANLISNALDAMPRGGLLWIRARRTRGLCSDGAVSKGVRVVVADTGIGMSRKTQDRIFEAFFTTKETTGTGLGLWVSEEIIRKHSGTVRVRSREGVGTAFVMFFPDRPRLVQ